MMPGLVLDFALKPKLPNATADEVIGTCLPAARRWNAAIENSYWYQKINVGG